MDTASGLSIARRLSLTVSCARTSWMRSMYARRIVRRCSSSVHQVTRAVTFGLPSRSPPTHERNLTTDGTSKVRPGKASESACSRSDCSHATTSRMLRSKKYRTFRASSATVMGARRISSVSQSSVSARVRLASARSVMLPRGSVSGTESGPAAWSLRHSATRKSLSSTARRRASVGCAVSVGPMSRLPISANISSGPRPLSFSRMTASRIDSGRDRPGMQRARFTRMISFCSAVLMSWKKAVSARRRRPAKTGSLSRGAALRIVADVAFGSSDAASAWRIASTSSVPSCCSRT